MNRKTFRGALVVVWAVLSAACAAANAGTLTIDFEDGPYGSGTTPYSPTSGTNNFLSQHFVFSPGCHFDWLNVRSGGGTPAPFGHWLGFDSSGCYDDPSGQAIGYNKNYLGPSGPVTNRPSIFIQHEFGALFDVESFIFASIADDIGGYQVRSSKGGLFQTSYSDGMFTGRTLSGEEWRDVAWIEFSTGSLGAPVGFDQLVLKSSAISEPASAFLVGMAGLALFCLRNRKSSPAGKRLDRSSDGAAAGESDRPLHICGV